MGAVPSTLTSLDGFGIYDQNPAQPQIDIRIYIYIYLYVIIYMIVYIIIYISLIYIYKRYMMYIETWHLNDCHQLKESMVGFLAFTTQISHTGMAFDPPRQASTDGAGRFKYNMATNCLQVSQKELYGKLVCLKTRPKRPSRPLNSNLASQVAHIGVAGVAKTGDVMCVTNLFESLPP